MPSLEAMVNAWNIQQIYTERSASGVLAFRNLDDIGPGTKYARMGMEYYNPKRAALLKK